MPVYHRHRLVHIHIPKTGGTAIEGHFHSVGDMTWGPASWLGGELRNGRWYELQHLTWRELAELSEFPLETYASFAVVRDPYSRLVSDFLWRRRIVTARPWSTMRCFDSFRDFLLAIPQDVDCGWSEHIEGGDREQASFLIHVRPQHHFIFDRMGNCLVDDVLRFENLDLDFARLLERREEPGAPTIRRPAERSLGSFYDRDLIDRVDRLYDRDFERLGYERI